MLLSLSETYSYQFINRSVLKQMHLGVYIKIIWLAYAAQLSLALSVLIVLWGVCVQSVLYGHIYYFTQAIKGAHMH